MLASPKSAKQVLTSSWANALARMSYTRSLASLFIRSMSGERLPVLNDPFAHCRVRQCAAAGIEVVDHVFRLVGTGNDGGDRRVSEDELEEELRPGLRAEFGGEVRQRSVARLAEQRIAAERQVDEHRCSRVARRGQQRFLGLERAERVVHLQEIGLLPRKDLSHRTVAARLAGGDAGVATTARFLP